MKRSRAPSFLFKSSGMSISESSGVNHLDIYKIPDPSEKSVEEVAEEEMGRVTRGKLREEKDENAPPPKNVYIDEDSRQKVFYICHFTEIDGKTKKFGDGLLEVSYAAVFLYDMNSKVMTKTQIVRSEYKKGDQGGREGEQRVAMKTQKRKELFFCEGQQVLISRFLIEIGVEVEEEEVLDGTIFFRENPDERLMDVIKEKKKDKKIKVVVPGSRLRWCAPGHFRIPWKSDNPGGKRPRLVQPLHSPTGQNAVVLYKPLVDVPGKVAVVVDPILGSKLRPHQIEGVQFMFDCLTGLNGKKMKGSGCILADDMGLGKSLQAIALLWTLLKQGPEGEPVAEAALIICPSSLVQNWVCELKKWLGEAIRPVAIADSGGNPKRKLTLFEGDNDVLIISYDQLKIHCNEIYKMKTIGLLIADEGHRLKNAHIKTTQAAAAVPAKRRVILSGTPIQNDLKEFYSMVSFVNPHVFGNETKFRNVFEDPVLKSREPGSSKEEKKEGLARMRHLTRIVSQLILRRTFKTNMKYLPPKTECTLFCQLTDFQRELYESLLTETKEMVLQKNAESGRGKSPALSLLTTLKKLCNSPDLLLEMTVRKPDSLPPGVFERLKKMKPKKNIECHAEYSGKVSFTKTLLLKIFKESPDRVVIVSMYKQTLEVLAVLCRQNGIKYLQLDGETSIKKRQVLVDQLNDPNGQERVMLLSSKAGGVGLNLIGANHLILFDGSWNPADDAQAMARVWRPGQQKECFIYRLLCTGTVEEKIYQRQLTKNALSTRIVEQQKGNDGSNFSTSELRDLFSLRKETICETHDLLGCRCSKSIRTFGMGRVSVDELMYWEHVSDITKSTNSALALAGEGIVTFMFSKRMDTKQASEDQDQQVQKDDVFFEDLKGEEGSEEGEREKCEEKYKEEEMEEEEEEEDSSMSESDEE